MVIEGWYYTPDGYLVCAECAGSIAAAVPPEELTPVDAPGRDAQRRCVGCEGWRALVAADGAPVTGPDDALVAEAELRAKAARAGVFGGTVQVWREE